MTKAEIVTQIADKTGIDRVAISGVAESFTHCIKTSIIKGENIFLRGFGSLI